MRRRYAEAFAPEVTLGRHRYNKTRRARSVPQADDLASRRRISTARVGLSSHTAPSRARSSKSSAPTRRGKRRDSANAAPRRYRAMLEKIFASELGGGHVLPPDALAFRHYQTVSCGALHHRNVVLLGDAAHTTHHYSQGFGTMFAFDDAVALHPAFAAKLRRYRRRRSHVLRRCSTAENRRVSDDGLRQHALDGEAHGERRESRRDERPRAHRRAMAEQRGHRVAARSWRAALRTLSSRGRRRLPKRSRPL